MTATDLTRKGGLVTQHSEAASKTVDVNPIVLSSLIRERVQGIEAAFPGKADSFNKALLELCEKLGDAGLDIEGTIEDTLETLTQKGYGVEEAEQLAGFIHETIQIAYDQGKCLALDRPSKHDRVVTVFDASSLPAPF